MIRAFVKHIETNFSQLKNQKLLVACSGGLDSVVLTHLLHQQGYTIALAHCNFSLRGDESDADAAFVAKLAEKLTIPYHTVRFDTLTYAKEHKISTQMAARDLRYQWFQEILKAEKLDLVLTAHHADDAMETFFINLSRGTGIKGLLSIPAVNETIIRPLLPFSRAEILAYAKKKNYYWREDSSNESTKYLRNQLRHQVIPSYKKVGEQVLSNFKKTQHHLAASHHLIEDYMALIFASVVAQTPEGYAIDIAKLQDLPHTEAVLYELLASFGFTAWEDISGILTAQSGKQIVSKTHRLLKDRTSLLLTAYSEKSAVHPVFTVALEKYDIATLKQIEEPIKMCLIPTDKMGYIDNSTIYVDISKISFPLVLRKWAKGDVFHPFGLKGKKKISKFFKDEKLSLAAKENVWLLCDTNHIIWVVGHRASELFKVTETTQQIIKITTTL